MSEMQQSEEPHLSPEELDKIVAQHRARQSIALAIVGGLIGALVGAAIWGGITAATHFQIGWMAVGVGFMTGFLVRILGKGIDPTFGIIGAFFALLGCVLGNVLADVVVVAQATETPLMEALTSHGVTDLIEIFKASFSWIDLIFYAIAVYEGFQFSINHVRE